MSDYDAGYEPGHEAGHEVDYNQYEAGQEHNALDQLHQEHAAESDYNNQFAVYEQDHAAAEHTDYDQGNHVEYDNPAGAHYEQDNYTSYNHDAAEHDHVFAAEGSESSHQPEYDELDSLRERLDSAFAEGTHYHGGEAEIAAK